MQILEGKQNLAAIEAGLFLVELTYSWAAGEGL